MEPAGGVGDDEVRAAGDGRVERVVHDRARVGARARGPRPGRPARSAQIRSWSMAAARNVSAAARMIFRPSAEVARGELADGRRLAGAVDADDEHDRRPAPGRRLGRPVEVALDEQRIELGADRRLRAAGVAPCAGALDEVHGERRSDIAGDERLLDVVPLRPVGVAEEAAQLGHEPAAGPFESLVEGVGRGDREERGRIEWRVGRSLGDGRGPVGRFGRSARVRAPARGPAEARARSPARRLGGAARARSSARRRVPASRLDRRVGLRLGAQPPARSGSIAGSTAGCTGAADSSGASSRRRRQNGISRPTRARAADRSPAPGPRRAEG